MSQLCAIITKHAVSQFHELSEAYCLIHHDGYAYWLCKKFGVHENPINSLKRLYPICAIRASCENWSFYIISIN